MTRQDIAAAIAIASIVVSFSAIPSLCLADEAPSACNEEGGESGCNGDTQPSQYITPARNRARARALAVHPGTTVGRIEVDCEAESMGPAGIVTCRVTIDLPLLNTDFECHVGFNDNGFQYIDCHENT
jgi:hypothetical protein